MFHSNRRLNLLLWLMLAAFASGCTGGGCTSCAYSELPEGGLPASQTIEGGAQIRITDSGFATMSSLVTSLFTDLVGDGFCVGPQMIIEEGDTLLGAEVGACFTGTCNNGDTGCNFDVTLNNFSTSVDGNSLTISASFDAATRLDLDAIGWILGEKVIDEGCSLDATLDDGTVSFDIGVGVDSGTGELDIDFQTLHTLDFTGFNMTGCGVVGDGLNEIVNLFASVADFLTDEMGLFFGPVLAELVEVVVDQLLPDPLGLAGVVDLSSSIGQFSPSTKGALESKLIPGGYAYLENDGLSLGVITGMNADRDPSTRTPETISEPALCVPPMSAPDFAVPPASLMTTARNYGDPFALLPADVFRGSPDPFDTDVAIGASETMLDLIGHHLVTSGAMCLAISTEAIPQFNLGTIGLVVPSLSELGSPDGRDPLMLVTRPLEAVDFTIGSGEGGEPALIIDLKDFEVDFYAFIFERWVRGFSIRLDAQVGIDLEFTVDGEGNPAIIPVLSGLEAENLGITVLNAEFLRETEAELEAIFPALLDLALPLVTGAIGDIALPSFAGFTLSSLDLVRVQTSEDDFLAIFGSLGTTQALGQMFESTYPTLAETLKNLEIQAPEKSDTEAKLASVNVPRPAKIREGLLEGKASALPTVTIDVPAKDDKGRDLEYSWSLSGGLWRPFEAGNELVLRDPAFAIQGRYEILVRARRVGDYTSLDETPVSIPVVIDSAPPRIVTSEITMNEIDMIIPAYDLVSDEVRLAFSAPGKDGPTTEWMTGPIDLDVVYNTATDKGLKIWAVDEQGNRSSETIPFDGNASSGGGCNAGGSIAGGGLLYLGTLIGLLGIGRRRRRRLFALARKGAPVAFALAVLMTASCGASSDSCELNTDCVCEGGLIPICTEVGECLCADDIPVGQIGQYSSMTLAGAGTTWLAGYNATHGDLMVAQWSGTGRVDDSAWQFIDGVPEGPVVLEESEIRGGIADEGDDVGLYTDIAESGGTVYVSYFDQSHAALKIAVYDGVAWSTHTLESGNTGNPEGGNFRTIGPYSTITIGSDGRPGVAYFVQSGSGDNVNTTVEWAQASTVSPRSAGDWAITEIDSGSSTQPTPGGLTIPEGNGLFLNSTRMADGNPAIVYYDRTTGSLKLATGNGSGFTVETLDGETEGVDVGWYPSVAVDQVGVLHISYVDAINNDLLYINTADRTPELVDDGYRLVGTNSDGLPKPEFQFVGDDSAIVMTGAGPVIAYQNATTHALLLAQKVDDSWAHDTIAGGGETFTGGYGFYAEATVDGLDVLMSTWVLDQPGYDAWVEIFSSRVGVE